MQKTKIPWCTHTWNPVVGCTKIATGCKNCYAEKMAHRLAHMGKEGYAHVTTKEGKWNGNIYHVFNNRLNQPLRWHKPSRVYRLNRRRPQKLRPVAEAAVEGAISP